MINMIKCGIYLAIAKGHIFEVAELSEYVVISQMHILITRTCHRQFRLAHIVRRPLKEAFLASKIVILDLFLPRIE